MTLIRFFFLLLSGNDDGLFAIYRSTGNITVNGTVDAESTDFFRITVRVSFDSVHCMIPASLSNSSNYGQGCYTDVQFRRELSRHLLSNSKLTMERVPIANVSSGKGLKCWSKFQL